MSESFELGDQPAGVEFLVASQVPVGAEVSVGLVAGEHVVGDHDHRVSDGDLGSARAAASGDAGVLFGEVVLAVHPPDRSGRFDEDRGQPFVPVPAARRPGPTGRFVDP